MKGTQKSEVIGNRHQKELLDLTVPSLSSGKVISIGKRVQTRVQKEKRGGKAMGLRPETSPPAPGSTTSGEPSR